MQSSIAAGQTWTSSLRATHAVMHTVQHAVLTLKPWSTNTSCLPPTPLSDHDDGTLTSRLADAALPDDHESEVPSILCDDPVDLVGQVGDAYAVAVVLCGHGACVSAGARYLGM